MSDVPLTAGHEMRPGYLLDRNLKMKINVAFCCRYVLYTPGILFLEEPYPEEFESFKFHLYVQKISDFNLALVALSVAGNLKCKF